VWDHLRRNLIIIHGGTKEAATALKESEAREMVTQEAMEEKDDNHMED